MRQRIDKPSGASGEVSPLLYARSDLSKQQASDRDVINFTVLAEGARTRTPGTKFVTPYRNEARPARFVSFEAAVGDSYLLVFNDNKMRVFKDGGPVYDGATLFELDAPFTDAELEKLSLAQSKSVLFLATGGKPKRLTRNSDVSWELVDYPSENGPVRIQNTDQSKTIQASSETGSITLTANFDAFKPGHVGSTWRLDEKDFSQHPVWKALETPIGLTHRRRNKGRIYEVVALNAGTGDTGPNPPTHDEGDVFSSGGNVTWRYVSASGGYVKITGVLSPTSATAEVMQRLPASIVTIPTYRWFEAAWSDERGWPRSVSIVDQSLLWTREDEWWMTKASDIYSFDQLDEEDAAVSGAINSPDGKLVDIQWSLPTGVIVFGSRSSEWVVRGPSMYERLTATNARAIPQANKGSAPSQPVMVDGGAVYIGRSRRKLHFAKFDAVTEKVEFQNFMNYARHVLRAGAYQLAWQADPHEVLWVRRGDGTLAGVTFKPDEDVLGHHQRIFENGFVEQIACVQSGDDAQTELWLGIRRTINGVTRRYIEVMQPYFDASDDPVPTAKGAWFLDCALKYAGDPATTISNLGHLEGESVRVFADGRHMADAVVAAGAITLPTPKTEVLVGLPIEARIKSLPFEGATQKGVTKGLFKSSNRVVLHMLESQGGALWSGYGALSPVHFSGGNTPGAPLPLTTGLKPITIDPASDIEFSIELVCADAFPFTLLGWTPELDIKDS